VIIEITEDHRQQIAGMLATHIHNMQTAFVCSPPAVVAVNG
jgi:hypothetical protein